MFYAHFVLSKKGPLARIWLAAHWDKKLTRAHVFETNISSSVEAILEPKLKMALRTSGHLLLGVVRIYSRKAKYLLADCNEAFVKIKMAFRPGMVDLPDEANREAAIAAITLPENIHDFEATIADLNEINMNTIAINQSRPEDITMREDFGEINLGRQDDDFGDSAFDEVSSREVIREGESTFVDGIYHRRSDQLSVRSGGDFTIRSDEDVEATLIGGSGSAGRSTDKRGKQDVELGVRSNEMPIDEHGFGDGFLGPPDDDDDENFGGAIDHSLFADAGIFEDPSAQKQLEHLTSEIESHMDVANLGLHGGTTPILTAGAQVSDQDGGPANMPTTSIADHLPEGDFFATTTTDLMSGPAAAIPTTSVMSASKIGLGISSISKDNTTLLTNESEAFALPPIDATSTSGIEPRRAGKRKRRLIVDEQKSIPSEIMKLQMEDTSDITTQLDLAPPTKKLMHWKETGSVDKLFTLPGRAIPSRFLQRLFARNLHTLSVPDDAPEEQGLLPQTIVQTTPTSFQSTQAMDSAFDRSAIMNMPTPQDNISGTSNVELLTEPSPMLHFGEQIAATAKLGPIAEVSEEQEVRLTGEVESEKQPVAESVEAAVIDNAVTDDLAFMVEPETPYLAPPSVLSEAPPSMMQADMLALERELAAADEDDLASAFGATGRPDDHDGFAGFDGLDVTDAQITESLQERRLEKRSKVMLRMLRAHQQQHNWEESLTLQQLCIGNTKKQAASKFYTILLLRKQCAVELEQAEAYADIKISRGPNFLRLIET